MICLISRFDHNSSDSNQDLTHWLTIKLLTRKIVLPFEFYAIYSIDYGQNAFVYHTKMFTINNFDMEYMEHRKW